MTVVSEVEISLPQFDYPKMRTRLSDGLVVLCTNPCMGIVLCASPQFPIVGQVIQDSLLNGLEDFFGTVTLENK